MNHKIGYDSNTFCNVGDPDERWGSAFEAHELARELFGDNCREVVKPGPRPGAASYFWFETGGKRCVYAIAAER